MTAEQLHVLKTLAAMLLDRLQAPPSFEVAVASDLSDELFSTALKALIESEHVRQGKWDMLALNFKGWKEVLG